MYMYNLYIKFFARFSEVVFEQLSCQGNGTFSLGQTREACTSRIMGLRFKASPSNLSVLNCCDARGVSGGS